VFFTKPRGLPNEIFSFCKMESKRYDCEVCHNVFVPLWIDERAFTFVWKNMAWYPFPFKKLKEKFIFR
jgi:hypothetical protein